jgi:hypothetical protein
MMPYFWNKLGKNRDIERHREKQAELEFKIAQLEAKETLSESDEIYMRTYRQLLNSLLQSKAEIVEKIGRK